MSDSRRTTAVTHNPDCKMGTSERRALKGLAINLWLMHRRQAVALIKNFIYAAHSYKLQAS
ncbi:hypothetical protein Ciccas_008270 [Cichlidogyrus casuarinus]|uniref:Transposase n=1 Tax=Cichlidogyrus casuarinus TaxID=1844966 RepID=A0ABD2Q191_9PLAT